MTHLPYIAAAYTIAVGVPLVFAIQVLFRARTARRRHRDDNLEAVLGLRPRPRRLLAVGELDAGGRLRRRVQDTRPRRWLRRGEAEAVDGRNGERDAEECGCAQASFEDLSGCLQ